jgi:D-arabinono-1,4-lactone oxidase
MTEVDARGFLHPANEDEVINEIIRAGKEHRKLRVHGSEHSVAGAFEVDNGTNGEPGMVLVLDHLKSVEFDDDKCEVTVGGGCCLGANPLGHFGPVYEKDSLVWKLRDHGWALPATGGILHQTVAGFISTGSAGSSLKHSLVDQVVAVRIVDGLGVPHTYRQDDPGEEFYGAVVSLGLLGVIVSVTFKCEPAFNIEGEEITHRYGDTGFSLFPRIRTSQAPPLATFFKSDYGRCIWWPQKGIEKFRFWDAKRLDGVPAKPFPKRYRPIRAIITVGIATFLLSIFMRFFADLNPPGPSSRFGKLLRPLKERLFVILANSFLTCGIPGRQQFRESWADGLPMDNRINHRRLSTQFSEMWVPFDSLAAVVAALYEFYSNNGISRVGTYCIELYPTPASKFWLSPAFEQRVMKIDFYWYAKNKGNPGEVFFPQFWDILMRFNCRFHWGKFMPGPGYLPDFPKYLGSQFSRMNEFLELRERRDPQQLFVTRYWRDRLGIAEPASALVP